MTPSATVPTVRHRRGDEGTIVVGWLWKVGVLLIVATVVCLELVGQAATRLTISDDAASIARQAANTVPAGQMPGRATAEAAYSAAATAARGYDAKVLTDDFAVYPDGQVRLTVEQRTYSLVLRLFPQTRSLTVVKATALEGRPYL